MDNNAFVAALMDTIVSHITAQLTPALSRMIDDKIAEANTSGVAAAAALDHEQFSAVIATVIENDSTVRDCIGDLVTEAVERITAGSDLTDHSEFRDLESRVSDVEDFESRIDFHASRLDELEVEIAQLKSDPVVVSEAELVSALRALLLNRIA